MMKLAAISIVVTLPVTLGVLLNTQPTSMQTCDDVDCESADPVSVAAPGRVEGTTPEVDLRLQLEGRITKLLVEEGQLVREDDVLLCIDDAQLRHEVTAAEAEVELAQAQLERLENGARAEDRAEAAALYKAKLAEMERAQLDWRRGKALLKTEGAITRKQADDYRTLALSTAAEAAAARARYRQIAAPARADEVRIAKARILAAEARLEQSRVLLERTQLKAPSGGQILKLNVELGELVAPDSVEPVIVMADTSRFCVRAFVEELDAPRVTAGMNARIVADGLPNQEFTGHVTRVSPRMSNKTLWTDAPAERFDAKVREICIDCDDPVTLVVGLRVDVFIEAEPGDNAEVHVIQRVPDAVAAIQKR